MADIDLTRSIVRAQAFGLNIPLCTVQHLRRLNGSTQAHLMLASDGEMYAVKFQNNPQSARALASEFLATRLGLWLGLPMPQVEVIEVSERLVNHALLRIEHDDTLTRCASGRQLALHYMPHALESVPRSSARVTNSQDLICALPFDKWTGNCDNRQAVFMRQGRRDYRVTLIDQHHCFNASHWTFPDLPQHGTYEHIHIYQDVTGWQWFEPTLRRIEKISRFDLWQFATEIPPEWYGYDTRALSRLVERLYKRRFVIRELITTLRQSTGDPFPQWKGH